MQKTLVRLYAIAGLTASLLGLAIPARAQYRPRPLNDPATGESYHIEVGAGFWRPTAKMVISSESLGIPGTPIDFKNDLGLSDKRFPEFQIVLRPAKRHKFRGEAIPIKYDAVATLSRDIIFNGIRYRVGLPVSSSLDWKAYRLGYEYDFVSRNSGFAGLILEAKYTDVNVELITPPSAAIPTGLREYAHARAPIPAIGGIARYYVVPNISITGELTGFTVPSSISADYNAHYVDFDIYGTLNFTNNVGVKAGYRSLNVGYMVKADTGSFVLRGLYFGAVLRVLSSSLRGPRPEAWSPEARDQCRVTPAGTSFSSRRSASSSVSSFLQKQNRSLVRPAAVL